MNVYFASDFHLKYLENEEDKARNKRVTTFLKSLVGKADYLILGGDIFDLWYSWNTVMIKDYFFILKTFADLAESGCKIIFIAGNHDFWFRDFLTEYIGMEIYPDQYSTVIDGKKILVTHGDLYTKNDLRYKIFRKMVRNKVVMKFFEILHPDLSLRIVKLMSRSSRNYSSSQKVTSNKEAGLLKYAEKMSDQYDLIVMGHSHKPKLVKVKNSYYGNTGDWIKNNSFIKMIDGEVELVENEGKGRSIKENYEL